ncbi:MAG: hypothetical protein QOI41_165 [Myxococcales bacterium]|nr:hypothetical protein [Myxococcales bacterium]
MNSLLFATATTALLAVLPTVMGCRDVSRYSSKDGDHFEGDVVKGSFVRAGVAEDAKMCLVLDAGHLQDGPGTFSTSDGRFKDARIRPIPQIWHDPLSTLTFGEGRSQNLVYVASPSPSTTATASDLQDVMVFLSLMDNGALEVRLVRGAPVSDAGTPAPAIASPLFGVFTLDRHDGACSF